ncbi:MAG: sterol desaturase family protein [Flavobacteriaceae bacterium]|nr:sterol desaturase family protein [Flavobacteriaceae bacterium]
MKLILFFFVLLLTFLFMEFMAWFSHKYIMHGFLWSWHKDHHVKNHHSWFEKNDRFFLFYAFVSMCFFISWSDFGMWFGLPISLGIFLYGCTYFIVHDVFIHRRFKFFNKSNNRYAKALRLAHKIHHKNINKKGGECFGMLFIPFKYYRSTQK